MERFGESGGLREHRRPAVLTPELRAFDRAVPEAIPAMWRTFAAGSRWSARGRVHAMTGNASACDARLRNGVVVGGCECVEAFALVVAETVVTVRERFVDDPHYRPARGYAETLRFTFDNGGSQNVKREQRLARCALVAEGSLRDTAIWQAMPDEDHRALLVVAAGMAGWYLRYQPERPGPFHDRLAESVAARVGGSVEQLRPRIPAMFETVREIANRTSRAKSRVCTGELLPWFDATVLHPLTDHTGDVQALLPDPADGAPREEPGTPRDQVERRALATVEVQSSGLHAVSPRAGAALALTLHETAPLVAHLLAAYLPERADRAARVRAALRTVADRGLVPPVVVDSLLAAPDRIDDVLAGLAAVADELLA